MKTNPVIVFIFSMLCSLFAANRATGTPVTTASLIVSWNACSRQFIEPPVFKVLRLPGAAGYRAVVRQGEESFAVTSRQPALDLAALWPRVEIKKFTLTLEWLDEAGRVIHKETSQRVKAPDFKGLGGPDLDWAAAADRNIAYLINAAGHAQVSYREPGVPAWMWAATPVHKVNFPCITIGPIIWALQAHAAHQRPQAGEALRLARASADWLLKNRQPETGVLPLFPYSTVSMGKFGGYVEGSAVNLLRASWLANSLVDLYAATHHEPYLVYARHIADTTLKLQAPDGSFPYRVEPATGAVVEKYSCNAMEFVDLVEALEPYGYDERRALAARRAVDWLIAYVCTSHNGRPHTRT